MPPLRELQKVSKSALVITAHPDDESIFMGGTIAEFKKWRWHILCATDCDERYNKTRREELLRVCRIYKMHGSKVEPFMLGVVKKKGRFSKAEIIGKIKDYLRTHRRPDIVFTHNITGEYGHKTHKLIYKAVTEAGLRNIYTFSCGAPAVKYRSRTEPVKLSRRSFSVKRQAVRLYIKGSQRSNLSRLRRVVDNALSSPCETFYRHG